MGAKKIIMDENGCKLQKENSLRVCNDFGEYAQYEEKLYKIFLNLYEHNSLVYAGKSVCMKHYPPDYGEKTGFYHMICEDYQHTKNEEDRKPNIRRCERIEWAKELIEGCPHLCDKIMIWENERHGKRNILLFCPDLDYLVVLGKRKDYFLLTTAYPVDYPNRRNDLISEYSTYISKQRTMD